MHQLNGIQTVERLSDDGGSRGPGTLSAPQKPGPTRSPNRVWWAVAAVILAVVGAGAALLMRSTAGPSGVVVPGAEGDGPVVARFEPLGSGNIDLLGGFAASTTGDGLVVHGGAVYSAVDTGGADPAAFRPASRRGYLYRSSDASWVQLSPSIEGRRWHAVVSNANEVFLVGGNTDSVGVRFSTTVEALSSDGSWTIRAADVLPVTDPSAKPRAVKFGSSLGVLAGSALQLLTGSGFVPVAGQVDAVVEGNDRLFGLHRTDTATEVLSLQTGANAWRVELESTAPIEPPGSDLEIVMHDDRLVLLSLSPGGELRASTVTVGSGRTETITYPDTALASITNAVDLGRSEIALTDGHDLTIVTNSGGGDEIAIEGWNPPDGTRELRLLPQLDGSVLVIGIGGVDDVVFGRLTTT